MDTLKTARRAAKWMTYLGLACGVLYSFGGFIVDLLTIGLNWGTAMAFGALVGMPVLFGSFGFLCGALVALAFRGVGYLIGRIRLGSGTDQDADKQTELHAVATHTSRKCQE